MPSFHHEALLQLFRNRPLLAAELLRDALHEPLPSFSEARVESAELTDIQPAEYRADLVVALLQRRAVLAIIVEVQLSRDDNKKYAWPAYVSNLRARLRCPVCLLVITSNEAVYRWAKIPIEMGGEHRMTPYVLSPPAVPQIIDPACARADPELAVFSAMAHGSAAELETSVRIAAAALAASADLDAARAALYVDLVLNSIPEAARRALQAMNPANYRFQSEFAKHYFSLGKEEGKAEGKAEGAASGKADLLIKLATVKFGEMADDARARIHAATNAEIDRIAERLLDAATLEEALQ